MVNAYIHPMRMTYLIQPGPFFRTKLGKACQTFSSLELFEKERRIYCPLSLLAAASWYHEEIHQIYGPLESILFDQGFPVEYELDEFNPPHTGTTLCHLQNVDCDTKFRSDIQLLHPRATFSGGIHAFPPNKQDHTLMGDYIIPVLNQQTWLATPMATISHSHIQLCLNPNDARFAQAFSC